MTNNGSKDTKNCGDDQQTSMTDTDFVEGASTSKTAPTELSVDASAVYLKDGGA